MLPVLGVPWLSSQRLALCHPPCLPLLPLESAFINTGWQRSYPLSGCLSTLAPVAGGETAWPEAARGGLGDHQSWGDGGGREKAKCLFVKRGVTWATWRQRRGPLGKGKVTTKAH